MDTTESIRRFIEHIGIPITEGAVPENSFLPGVTIVNGGVVFDRSALAYPGDLLHEAGHIALTEPSARANLNQQVLDQQSAQQSEEIGVLLWTYLAAKEIGLAPEEIFHAGGYKNQSNWLIEQFEQGTYIGLPLLVWMGVVQPNTIPPEISSWLRVP